jgi:hypothetical protein
MVGNEVKLPAGHLKSRMRVDFHKQTQSNVFVESTQAGIGRIDHGDRRAEIKKQFGWRGRIYQLTDSDTEN